VVLPHGKGQVERRGVPTNNRLKIEL
jgi:hypothetical protein